MERSTAIANGTRDKNGTARIVAVMLLRMSSVLIREGAAADLIFLVLYYCTALRRFGDYLRDTCLRDILSSRRSYWIEGR